LAVVVVIRSAAASVVSNPSARETATKISEGCARDVVDDAVAVAEQVGPRLE
jgi:hypothetical protein